LSAGSKQQNPPPQQNDAAGSLGLNTLSLDFGSVPVASSKTLTATATNNGTNDITVSSVTFSTPQFTLTEPTIPVTIAAGKSATLGVMFVPTAIGAISGSMTVTSDASNGPIAVALSGNGVAAGQITVNPAALNFGSVPVGGNQTLPVTLTNTGNSSA